jgi:Holliday junction resolvase RusA-like endonuclease
LKSKIVRFNITPQTNVRSTQGDRIYFRIPESKLHAPGLKRKLRLVRYNDYKDSIFVLSRKHQFTFPNQGCHIRFYIPCPRSWSQKKKARYHGMMHQNKPDIDNLVKAIFDSLFKEDKNVSHFQASKRWVDSENGWIEFEIQETDFPQVARCE